jgi:Rrf2 family protein
MADLAASNADEYVALRSIAERQQISEKYLEHIIAILSRAGFVKSTRGVQGGYKLARPAETYTAGEILRLTEGSLSPVSCLDDEPNQCPRNAQCVTLELWKKLDDAIDNVINNVTLADLTKKKTYTPKT